ncbi:type III-B CRISPR module RAMP protein Cmr1 [Arcicella sp. DC2W]|uniref:Type III-B CRISPR module RAMP protein Cmr1 n=1 Tax=Arcicella gelida TaxID=2984195 RepID=A0ABU5S3F5_9BACT|nr:type III-B CRISPR module RAMP protein Cmr1 [Arcicella sp. DC2W]MEA5402997.1 type III-B CRISPR module RAMP protein Cmr1 [Arcicella sp. DC2W]
MQTITFTCEVITPMFLAGADGTTPELRPASIKGALRFWWRAMNGHLPIDEMRKLEGEIFGSTQQRSKIIIRTELITPKYDNINKSETLHGRDYLMYSVFMNEKKAITSGSFKVVLSSIDKEALLEATYCFWLLSNIGALGTRSRRGCGRFIIQTYTNNKYDFKFNNTSNNLIEHSEYLRQGLNTIKKHFGTNSVDTKTLYPNFQNYSIYIIDNGCNKAEDALNNIGELYMNFRRRRQPDYDSVKEYIVNGTEHQTIEKASFGLPISYRYSSLKKSALIEGGNKVTRSASSLMIEIIKVGEKFYPILINFNSQLLESGVSLKLSSKEQKKAVYPNIPTTNLKNDFITSINGKISI